MFQYLLLLESDEDKEFFTEIYLKYRKEMFYTAYNTCITRQMRRILCMKHSCH